VCVVVTKDYSNVTNEECGQIHTRTVSVAEMSARLLSNSMVITETSSFQNTSNAFLYDYITWVNIVIRASGSSYVVQVVNDV